MRSNWTLSMNLSKKLPPRPSIVFVKRDPGPSQSDVLGFMLAPGGYEVMSCKGVVIVVHIPALYDMYQLVLPTEERKPSSYSGTSTIQGYLFSRWPPVKNSVHVRFNKVRARLTASNTITSGGGVPSNLFLIPSSEETSRIAPWVHYVPIQVSYADLYDAVAFFRVE